MFGVFKASPIFIIFVFLYGFYDARILSNASHALAATGSQGQAMDSVKSEPPKAPPVPLIVKATTPKQSYVPLEPISVDVEVENTPGFDVPLIQFDSLYRTCGFKVVDQHGKEVPLTKFGWINTRLAGNPKSSNGNKGRLRLKTILVLNRAYDMSLLGEYTVTPYVYYGTISINTKDVTWFTVFGKPFTIRIAAHNYASSN